ncbi:pyridine nucleotide-disulfide oxidoreductase family protein [Leishmania donovani]|uniref:Pyridine nucleotide-disulfide oxidoreductase family protein n=1 Tax=Leishmania donovani TaxID=5661 RepID=A0A504XWD3_LEIDO|nr:pyridine nucleotide-disulfide oxidoreductase family protein [Leishmania donovani]TPP52824.1 pyridine nucleotide-disulfide oxidoreductase family protein [Leishmania donovani]
MKRTIFAWTRKFDVCVLGGGPAGIAAAVRAYELGKKACIIEESRIGGADFWNGALQSKTLWEMAKFARYTMGNTSHRFMKSVGELPKIKHSNLLKAITNAAETRETQTLEVLANAEIEVLFGFGSFKTPNSVAVAKKDGTEETVEADYFVIATGAHPRPHPTAVADGKVVFTSDDIMMQPLPKSVVIIGAGVIGCEFASIFANFGSSSINDGKFHYTLRDVRDNSIHHHVTDSALVSIGRVPAISKLNLEAIGEQLKLKLDNLSTIMFLDQEVAAVGLNEQQCQKMSISYKMARYSYEYWVPMQAVLLSSHRWLSTTVTLHTTCAIFTPSTPLSLKDSKSVFICF